MSLQLASSSNYPLIATELAEALRDLLINKNRDSAELALSRYDAMFSTKPDVKCRCKEHAAKHDATGNGESVSEA